MGMVQKLTIKYFEKFNYKNMISALRVYLERLQEYCK